MNRRKPSTRKQDWTLLPDAWLLRFSMIIKSPIVRKLMVCRKLRTGLTTNTGWLHQCEDLEDFGGLTHYQKHVMIQEEGFWYRWYNMHCLRYIPLRAPREIKFHTGGYYLPLSVPEVGSLFLSLYDDGVNPVRSKVCVEISIKQKGKNGGAPDIMKLYDCWETVENMVKKKYAVTKLYGVTEMKLRESGNFSVELRMLPAEEYKK